jgi:hypothetical protein
VKAQLAAVEARKAGKDVQPMMVPVIIFAGPRGLFAEWDVLDRRRITALIGKTGLRSVRFRDSIPSELTDAALRDGEIKRISGPVGARRAVEHPNPPMLAEGIPIYGINYKDFDPNARF